MITVTKIAGKALVLTLPRKYPASAYTSDSPVKVPDTGSSLPTLIWKRREPIYGRWNKDIEGENTIHSKMIGISSSRIKKRQLRNGVHVKYSGCKRGPLRRGGLYTIIGKRGKGEGQVYVTWVAEWSLAWRRRLVQELVSYILRERSSKKGQGKRIKHNKGCVLGKMASPNSIRDENPSTIEASANKLDAIAAHDQLIQPTAWPIFYLLQGHPRQNIL